MQFFNQLPESAMISFELPIQSFKNALMWSTICTERFFLKFEAEGREFAKILRSQEQFVQTVKGQNNFW